MLRTLTTALLIWLTSFLFSRAVYTESGALALNQWIYQISLVFVLITAVVGLTSILQKHVTLPKVIQVSAFILVCVGLDVLITLRLYAQPTSDWLTSVLPVYLVIIPLNSRIATAT